MSDTLQKFMFDNSLVRGELVDISEAWRQVQLLRAYPPEVGAMLGEMMAAAALLAAALFGAATPFSKLLLVEASPWMLAALL